MHSPFGLCDACAHQRRVGNTRGSTFSLCGLARTDARFPKYPRMPVLRCEGFARCEDGPPGPAGAAPEIADAGLPDAGMPGVGTPEAGMPGDGAPDAVAPDTGTLGTGVSDAGGEHRVRR